MCDAGPGLPGPYLSFLAFWRVDKVFHYVTLNNLSHVLFVLDKGQNLGIVPHLHSCS